MACTVANSLPVYQRMMSATCTVWSTMHPPPFDAVCFTHSGAPGSYMQPWFVAITALMRPSFPSSIKRFTARTVVLKRTGKVVTKRTPACSTASRIAAALSGEMAMGLSQRISLPALAAAIQSCAWRSFFDVTSTAVMSGSARSSSRVAYQRAPNCSTHGRANASSGWQMAATCSFFPR